MVSHLRPMPRRLVALRQGRKRKGQSGLAKRASGNAWLYYRPHVAFYLDVVERNLRSGTFYRVDWGEIWRTVGAVSPAEWASIQPELRESGN